MPQDVLMLSVSTSITFTIGLVSLLLAFSAYTRSKQELVKEFSRRLMLVILVLDIYVLYWGIYNIIWYGNAIARFPLYLALIFVFVYLIWTVMSFQDLISKFGMSQEDKLDQMEKEELGNRG
jgi:uncharacterized ion transporter superfamily protein YfcC